MSGGSDGGDTAKKSTTFNASNKDITSRSSRDIGSTKPEASTNTRTMKDVQGERVDTAKPRISAPESGVGSKVAGGAKLLGLAKRATGIGSLLYSKDVGEGSDFKGTDKRPEAFEDVASKIPTETPKQPATIVKKPLPTQTEGSRASKYRGGRSDEDINRMISGATPDRMKAAEPEINRMADASRAAQVQQDNPGMKRGGAVKSKAKPTCMKTGGAVKSSGASRGDGCASRGRTKGKYC